MIAIMVIAESGDLTRFAHYRQYLNFCGFNLSAIQSGQKHSGYRLSKRGNARLRYAFWLAATVAVRTRENSFRYKYERYLRENGDKPDLVLSESGFSHGDLLEGHNQYVGRSLQVNGRVKRHTYNISYQRYLKALTEPAERYSQYGFKIIFQVMRSEGNVWNHKQSALN